MHTARRGGAGRRGGFQPLWLIGGLGLLGGLAWLGFRPGGWFRPAEELAIAGAEVQRGPLRISVVERGNLRAADSVVLKSEVKGMTTILWLIDEGATVAEGDLVCELDVTEQIDERFQREIAVRNAEAEYIKAKQAFEIQKSQNESDIAAAEQALTFARQDLVKFREGERLKLIKEAEEGITLAQEEFARAEEQLRWSTELESKGFLTSTELEADQLAKNRAGILLEQAKRNRDLLLEFELERQEDELVAGLAEAERELVRVKLQAAARLVDFEAEVKTEEAKLRLEESELADINEEIARGKLYAPCAGMVVYAREDDRYGREDPIAEGTQVRERQELITIPSNRGMVAEVSLHESVLKQVSAGQPCVVRVDAIPGREFQGQVSWVALLPDQNSWWANPNQRLYRTDVQLAGIASAGMRPGMSCQVEILVEDIADALYVPVQAVMRHAGENVAFVSRGSSYEVRRVEVGSYNDRWVEIEQGLAEGEVVLLAPPPGFALQSEGAEAAREAEQPPGEPGEEQAPSPRAGEDGRGAPGPGGALAPAGQAAASAQAPASAGSGEPSAAGPRGNAPAGAATAGSSE